MSERSSGPLDRVDGTRSGRHDPLLRTLAALGGEGTVGDLVGLLGQSRQEVDRELDDLIVEGRVHVRVTDEGHLVYRLGASVGRDVGTARAPEPGRRFDRKTLHLIRSRQGVLSIAELVEHTGTSVAEAEREMERLVAAYSGEAHTSLDGHMVYAFPLIMTRVRHPPGVREPRPAWSRLNDPMGSRRWTEGGPAPARWISRWAYGRGLLSGLRRLIRGVPALRLVRLRSHASLRRLALGHVFETALAGKGVVSVETTRRYLRARIGGPGVGRGRVERVLRRLAGEFGAPVSRNGRELFFGFRSVKRQFLAAEMVRRQLRLGEVVSGATVFDSGDSRRIAGTRELALFDEELRRTRSAPPS